jgi:cytochrome c553
MKKTIIVITSFIAVISMSFAFKKADPPKYENLKVLSKNTTKQEMDSIMRHFSLSLGVRCNFCHERGADGQNNFNFASDKNEHKLEARSMMKMTSKINKKYFSDHKADANMIGGSIIGGAVTCYSCHNGKEHPATRAPAPAPRTPGQPTPGTPPAQGTAPVQQ